MPEITVYENGDKILSSIFTQKFLVGWHNKFHPYDNNCRLSKSKDPALNENIYQLDDVVYNAQGKHLHKVPRVMRGDKGFYNTLLPRNLYISHVPSIGLIAPYSQYYFHDTIYWDTWINGNKYPRADYMGVNLVWSTIEMRHACTHIMIEFGKLDILPKLRNDDAVLIPLNTN